MTTKTVKSSAVDELADDANPPEYPDGAPLLKPYLQIRPRSQRAEFKRRYAEFADMQKRMQELQAEQQRLADDDSDDVSPVRNAERMRLWADMDDYYQKMDDLMRLAAVNAEAYTEWSDEVDDGGLAEVFTVFARRSQPGEASSSAT